MSDPIRADVEDSMPEADVMRRLGELIRQPAMWRFLEGVAWALRQQLIGTPSVKSTAATIPLELYGSPLPAGIKSSWVFVARDGYDHPAERHPGSIQRMFALDSAGAMEIWIDGAWRHCPLTTDQRDQGLSIPAYAWHRPVMFDHMWGVVSFQTVEPHELIEEIGDPSANVTAASRRYLEA